MWHQRCIFNFRQLLRVLHFIAWAEETHLPSARQPWGSGVCARVMVFVHVCICLEGAVLVSSRLWVL